MDAFRIFLKDGHDEAIPYNEYNELNFKTMQDSLGWNIAVIEHEELPCHPNFLHSDFVNGLLLSCKGNMDR